MFEFTFTIFASPFIGSFLGAVACRVPEGKSVALGRSVCPLCGAQIAMRDLVPVISWLMLLGKCRACHVRISPFYPAIELAAVGIPIWAFWVTAGWVAVATTVFGWFLLPLAIIDWRKYRLPDALTLPLIPSGLVAAWALDPSSVSEHAMGAAGGFLVLVGIAWAYRQVRHREGLGFGDAKLLAGLGAWVSWQGLPSVVLIAAASALLVVIARMIAGAPISWTDRVPFATFLAISGWLVWLYGPITIG